MEREITDMSSTTIRPATLADSRAILELVNRLAADQVMLPRSPASIIEHIRDFVVAEVDGAFAGCGALAIVWSDMAEIRSIAVEPIHQGLGLGRRMAETLIAEARNLGLPQVMAFTYVTGFFTGLGFEVVEHARLPHKVFNDCLNCPKFYSCDETAVLLTLVPQDELPEPFAGSAHLPLPGGGPNRQGLPTLKST
jgi:amino-acid N-acetyltransferase